MLEALQPDKSRAEIARLYDIHSVTVSRWKQKSEENGPELVSGDEEVKQYEQRFSQLERMLKQKVVEIALLKTVVVES